MKNAQFDQRANMPKYIHCDDRGCSVCWCWKWTKSRQQHCVYFPKGTDEYRQFFEIYQRKKDQDHYEVFKAMMND